jgi:hypothetical protein
VISGQVDLLLVQGAVALPQVRAGTIKALAELSLRRRIRRSRPLHRGLVRLLRAEGHAARHHRQAQRGGGAGAGRSGGESALFRNSASTLPRATGRRRKACVPKRRDGQVVADHQSGRYQGE